MKKIEWGIGFLILLFAFQGLGQGIVKTEDIQIIIGNWEGELTYLDYQTNQPYSLPANLNVVQGKSENKFILNNIYPNEPKANGSYKLKITRKGELLNKKVVKSRKVLDSGLIEIITEHRGKDNRKSALIRNTYLIGKKRLIIRKEVQHDKIGIWKKRNEFKYTR